MKKYFLWLIVLLILIPQGGVFAASPADSDKDGLSDEMEIALGTDQNDKDSDDDGFQDGMEVKSGFNPLVGNRDRQVKREVVVDLSKQKMDYFLNDVKVGTAWVSTGRLGTVTPNGEFSIIRKVPVIRYTGLNYDYKNTKWNLEFKKSFYLHGAYWHNQLGIRPMSHGCVNIAYKDAEKIYNFLDVGDKVKVIGKTPAGKLVKR